MWELDDVSTQMWELDDITTQMWKLDDVTTQMWELDDVKTQMLELDDVTTQMWEDFHWPLTYGEKTVVQADILLFKELLYLSILCMSQATCHSFHSNVLSH